MDFDLYFGRIFGPIIILFIMIYIVLLVSLLNAFVDEISIYNFDTHILYFSNAGFPLGLATLPDCRPGHTPLHSLMSFVMNTNI